VVISPSARVVSPALAIEPWTSLAVAMLLVIVAVLASVVPAVRAARIDPAAALRHD
jgi:ABC-type lipoprotein release transport system permease subunit